METTPDHGQVRMEAVVKRLPRYREPLTADCFYNPKDVYISHSSTLRGHHNVEGRVLEMMGMNPDNIASLSSSQARIIFEEGLLGSTTLQRASLPFFDSRAFPLSLRNGRDISKFLAHPEFLLGENVEALVSLAELTHKHRAHFIDQVRPIDWKAGSIPGVRFSDAIYARSTVLLAAAAIGQFHPDIRRYAAFTVQDIMREVAQGLPTSIVEIICLAANEVQVGGKEKTTVSVPDSNDLTGQSKVNVDTALFFLPHLVDPSGQPLTLDFLKHYPIEGWTKPTAPEALKAESIRFFALVRSKREQIRAAKDTRKNQQP